MSSQMNNAAGILVYHTLHQPVKQPPESVAAQLSMASIHIIQFETLCLLVIVFLLCFKLEAYLTESVL